MRISNRGYAIVLLCCIPMSSFAASFDCNKAKLATEKKICTVRTLNDADVQLVTVYNIVLRAVPMGGRDVEKQAQYQWLKQRNACGANVQCISNIYQTRQSHLDQILEQRVLSQGPF